MLTNCAAGDGYEISPAFAACLKSGLRGWRMMPGETKRM